MNNYNEEWSNNNYYNNNIFDNHNKYNDYSYTHSNKKKKYTKYYNNNNNNSYNNNNCDDNITDDNMSKSTNDSKQKNVLIKIKINTKKNVLKELIVYKDEDIESIINNFCNDNNIDEKLVIPLCNKINQSLNEINFVINNLELNKDDVMLINKAKKIVQNM